jgi:hypothetical protein
VFEKSKREDGVFSREDFAFDDERDIYTCPAGKILRTTGTVVNDDQALYRARKRDCDACPLKMQCCSKEPVRKVPRNIYEEARDVARALAKPKPTSDRAVIARKSRCCLPTSSASCVLTDCVCRARMVRNSSSR